MKFISFAIFILTVALSSKSVAQDGILDSSFIDDGIVTTDLGGFDFASSVAVRPDGKVIVAGYSTLNNWTYFAIAQYKIDGTLDSTFGSEGKVLTTFPEPSYGWSIALQPNGKIVVGGQSYIFWYMARYNQNGSLDSTFGNNGEVITETPDYEAAIRSLIIEEDGKILAIGYSGYTQPMSNIYYAIGVARYTSEGALEDGIDYYGHSGHDQGYSSYRQSDGKIVIASTSYGVSELLRVDSNFSLDNAFGDNGFVTTPCISYWHPAVAIQSNARIIVVGASANNEFLIARFTAGGLPDSSFGNGGIVANSVGAVASSVAIVEGDKIQVAGFSEQSIVVARYEQDGSLDSSFGSNGITITDLGINNYEGTTMAIAPGGKIVAAGTASGNFLVARYNSSLEFVNVDPTGNTFRNNYALIYPNPITQSATLKYTLQTPETISIHLLDVQGKILKTFIENEKQDAGEHQQEISFPDQLPSGFYFLKISGTNGGSVSVKVVK